MRALRTLPLLAAIAITAPLAAQNFSDGYTFLKAVRDRDGDKATELLSRPSTIVVDSRAPGTGEAGLHIVARRRDAPWLSFLLSRSANPNIRDSEGNTPLMVAASIGWVDGAETLLARRAGVDVANNAGETPLIRAVQNRDLDLVRVLLGAGADANRSDSTAGMSARDYAERDGRSAAILRLIEEPRAAPAPRRRVAGPGM